MQSKNARSWIELGLFTGLLFLLVAIPYTIYLKASTPSPKTILLTTQPVRKIQPTPILHIATPSGSVTVTCLPVSTTYQAQDATPAAYFFPTSPAKLCYPPQLPPYPFTWQLFHDYQHAFTIDIPSNWINKTTTVQGTLVHIYSENNTATNSASPTVSFAWYSGTDPLASDAAYSKKLITRDDQQGIVYTRYSNGILVIFPFAKGYLLLQSTTDDKGFYAFEHMLDSLHFTK